MILNKSKLKKIIKTTKFYQLHKANKYFKSERYKSSVIKDLNCTDNIKVVFSHKYKSQQYNDLFKKVSISLSPNSIFQTWIDPNCYFFNSCSIISNQPPCYKIILNHSIEELLSSFAIKKDDYSKEICGLLSSVKTYILKVVSTIDVKIEKEHNQNCLNNLQFAKNNFQNMLCNKATTFEDALQRILFWQSIFWQTGHTLVGIGRLDKLLANCSKLSNSEFLPNNLSRLDIIIEFYKALHKYYEFKSSSLLGDTGQIIILGGTEANGEYFSNDLTYDFINALIKYPLPDPKILLRVSKSMPSDLIELALKSNSLGIGCPLLANDEVIIPALEEFGYEHSDACNYVTSACWEPLSYGNSLEANNIGLLNYSKVFNDTFSNLSQDNVQNYEVIIDKFIASVKNEVANVLTSINRIQWEKDPLQSLFNYHCVSVSKDISEGGSKYNDYGILSVGLANAINSLFNLKKFVIDEKEISINDFSQILKFGYKNHQDIQRILSENSYYGKDSDEVIALVNRIISAVNTVLAEFKNKYGGKVKCGLSAPGYVEFGKQTLATFDGRDQYEPLAVHISAPQGTAFTELLNFSSRLNYSGYGSNGNVVDFFVSPDFVNTNFEKFVFFIKKSIENGFFQMQMNVLSSKTLEEALENPDKYTNLIVRVWGFSAYFNDLPQSYKELLIRRAKESEKSVF